jgi:hypothetical protein
VANSKFAAEDQTSVDLEMWKAGESLVILYLVMTEGQNMRMTIIKSGVS